MASPKSYQLILREISSRARRLPENDLKLEDLLKNSSIWVQSQLPWEHSDMATIKSYGARDPSGVRFHVSIPEMNDIPNYKNQTNKI